MNIRNVILISLMFPLFLACSKDEGPTISPSDPPDGPAPHPEAVKVYVDPTLTPDTAIIGEYIVISDTNTNYHPKYWTYQEVESDSFTIESAYAGLVQIQQSKDPMVIFIGPDRPYAFKQLEVEKVSIDQVPPLPEEFPAVTAANRNGDVVVYLAEDSVRFTRTYILAEFATYLLGKQEVEITEENRGREGFLYRRGGSDRFLLKNQNDMRLVIAYESSSIPLPSVSNQIIAMSDPFNPYDLEMNDGVIRIEKGLLGIDGFNFELKCKWVTN
jgi:hypothetical protein